MQKYAVQSYYPVLNNWSIFMEYESLLELVKARRSIRRFKPDPIPDEYINKIIEVARWAPSGYNSQPWDFIVIKDNKLREVLTSFDLHKLVLTKVNAASSSEERVRMMDRPWLDEDLDYRAAPVFIVLYGDHRFKIGLPDSGKTNPTRVQSILHSSLACAFLYMELAATSLGLATQWLGGSSRCYDKLKEVIGIPEEFEPYATVPIGYPAYKSRPKLLRSQKKMVHFDYCGKDDFRTQEEVESFARKTWIWTTANHRRGIDK
jgi:nitroreductase